MAWRISIVLVMAGIIVGSVVDPDRRTTPDKRGDYVVLQGDFHAHTRMSDGFLSPLDIPLAAAREGLDVIAVTEHNTVLPSQISRWFSELVHGGDGPIIVTGMEVTSKAYHLIALGIEETVDWNQPIEAVVDQIHAQDGLAIAAHPGRVFWPRFDPVMAHLDGSEVMHPIAFNPKRKTGWQWADFPLFWQQLNARRSADDSRGPYAAAIGSSDFHFFKVMGAMRTLVFAKEATAKGVIDALRAGKTVVYDLQGKAWGHPQMIALLQDNPVKSRSKDRAYSHSGPLDLTARSLGFLGLLGLVIFKRR